MRLTLTVPKPCHEDWNAMTPQENARFCASCQHSVADLTRATDAELVAIFSSYARPKCARFDPRQLDRLLGDPEASRRALPVAAFTSLLAVAAGQEAVAQGGVHVKGKPAIERPIPPNTLRMGKPRIDAPTRVGGVQIRMGEALPEPHPMPPSAEPVRPLIGDTVVVPQEVVTGQMQVRPNCASVNGTYYYIDGVKVEVTEGTGIPQSAIEEVQVITGGIPGTYGDVRGGGIIHIVEEGPVVRGRVLDASTGEALPFAVVRIAGTEQRTNTDFDGRFVLTVPDTLQDVPFSVEVVMVGFDRMRIEGIRLQAEEAPVACTDTADVARMPLSGRVVDSSTGRVLRGATVEWVETGLRCCTDAHGAFGFPVKDGAKGSITLRITATGHAAQERTLPLDKLPFCVPIALARGTEPQPSVERAPIDLGDLKLEERNTMILGMVVAHKPTLWQRVTRPFRRW
jgi:hypothetical protein